MKRYIRECANHLPMSLFLAIALSLSQVISGIPLGVAIAARDGAVPAWLPLLGPAVLAAVGFAFFYCLARFYDKSSYFLSIWIIVVSEGLGFLANKIFVGNWGLSAFSPVEYAVLFSASLLGTRFGIRSTDNPVEKFE